MFFETTIFQILALYLNFEGAENIHVQQVPILGLGGFWMLLTVVWHLDHELGMLRGLLHTLVTNLALYLNFEGAKNIYVLYVLIWAF